MRANKAVKGRPNMKVACFARWVNEDLLLNHALEAGYPGKISQETARKWIRELCYRVHDSKKGTYIDGHEWQDVTDNAPTPEALLSLP